MRTITSRTICDRTLVFRMVIAMTTFAMLGCRRAGSRISGRSFVAAFVVPRTTNTRSGTNTDTIRLLSSSQGDYDDSGRRVRTPRPSSSGGWGDDDGGDWGSSPSPPSRASGDRSDTRGDRRTSTSNNDSWDDFDPTDDSRQQQQPQRRGRDDYNNDGGGDWGTPRDRSAGRQQRQNDYDDNNGNDVGDDWGAPRDRPKRRQSGGGRGGSRRGDDFGRGRGGRGGRGDFGRGRGGRGRGGGDFGRGRGGRGRGGGGRNSQGDDSSSSRAINMNGLEGAGFVHLYGLSSVLNALSTGRRELVTSMEKSDLNDPRFDDLDDQQGGWDNGEDDDFDAPRRSSRPEVTVKPEAQFRPYLFVQERNRSSGSDRRGSKASAAKEVMKLAEERGVPIAHVDKGILNVLSGNRPHQGFALRCGKLFFESLSRIPLPNNARGGGDSTTTSSPALWLVLDEVVDPQNLGALLRSAYFLGGKKNNMNIGVLVCSKNSAPPSPVVSASSAGALEVVDVHSTSNLPRTLNQAREDGFRIIGASMTVPSTGSGADGDLPPPLYDLQDLPVRDLEGDNRPILLVMGSEGHGLRTLVAKACTEFVCIPSEMGGPDPMDDDDDNNNSEAGVDSLNVSVSAGIMLWHLLHGGN